MNSNKQEDGAANTDEQTPAVFTLEFTDTVRVRADTEETAMSKAVNAYGKSPAHFTTLDREAIRPLLELDEALVRVKFYPQRWVDDYARRAEAEGKDEFLVPLSEATDEDGDLYPDNSAESDQLKWSDYAPLWVREWDGPYYVVLKEIVDGHLHESQETSSTDA